MVLGYQYYEIVDEKVLKLFRKYKREYRAIWKRAEALAKKVGANPKLFATSKFGGEFSIRRFHFDRGNVPEGWTGDSQYGWRPYKKNPLYKKFQELGEVDTKEIETLLKHKLVFSGSHMYTFNFGWKNNRFVFRVPVFDSDTLKIEKIQNYKPPRGACKKLSMKQYNLLMAGVK